MPFCCICAVKSSPVLYSLPILLLQHGDKWPATQCRPSTARCEMVQIHLVLCSLELRFEAKAPRGRGPSDDPIRGTRLCHRISCRRWTCGSTRARLDNGVLEGQRHQWGRLGTALPYWYRSPWQFFHDESDASHPTWVGYKPLVLPQIRPLPTLHHLLRTTTPRLATFPAVL